MRTILVACAALIGGLLASYDLPAQVLDVQETGFTVTKLANGEGPKALRCSPGGVWGDYVCVADSGSSGGLIERIDLFDNVTVFASGLGFPVGMDIWPECDGECRPDYVCVNNGQRCHCVEVLIPVVRQRGERGKIKGLVVGFDARKPVHIPALAVGGG